MLNNLTKESIIPFIGTIVKFEDGAAIIETKNYFSDALKAKMFFNSDSKAPVLSKLGKGNARVGFSTNIDIDIFL